MKHGQAKTPTWLIWVAMVQRCGPTASGKNRAWYFDKGIRVCDRWKSYENFFADMGDRPDGHQIDRIDTNGNYEPGNCRWVTPKINSRNRTNNTRIEFEGELLTVAEWAEKKCWPRHVISNRLQYGWPIERILTEPVRKIANRPSNPAVGMNAGIEGGEPALQ
jgi:hypothetical protein